VAFLEGDPPPPSDLQLKEELIQIAPLVLDRRLRKLLLSLVSEWDEMEEGQIWVDQEEDHSTDRMDSSKMKEMILSWSDNIVEDEKMGVVSECDFVDIAEVISFVRANHSNFPPSSIPPPYRFLPQNLLFSSFLQDHDLLNKLSARPPPFDSQILASGFSSWMRGIMVSDFILEEEEDRFDLSICQEMYCAMVQNYSEKRIREGKTDIGSVYLYLISHEPTITKKLLLEMGISTSHTEVPFHEKPRYNQLILLSYIVHPNSSIITSSPLFKDAKNMILSSHDPTTVFETIPFSNPFYTYHILPHILNISFSETTPLLLPFLRSPRLLFVSVFLFITIFQLLGGIR